MLFSPTNDAMHKQVYLMRMGDIDIRPHATNGKSISGFNNEINISAFSLKQQSFLE